MRIRTGAAIGVMVCLTVACKKHEPLPPAPVPSAVASSTPPPPETQSTRSAKKQSAQASKTRIPSETRDAYATGLQKGRTETRAKRYAAAVLAFDAALRALPGDARALAERGYAKLLEGNLEGAYQDLHEALTSTKEPKLLAQIHYNLGLCAEKLDKRDEAQVSFVRANQLAPSPRAAAKAGALTCSAQVSLGSKSAIAATDYRALFDALASRNQESATVASEEAAKGRLQGRVGDAAHVVSYAAEEFADLWLLHAYLRSDAGYLVDPEPASTLYGLPCGGEVSSTAEETEELVLVRVDHAPGMRVPVCEDRRGDLMDCGPSDIPVTSACGTADTESTFVVFDRAKGAVVARISFTDGDAAPKVRLSGRTLRVEGGGCDTTHALSASATHHQ